jgi:hypothetical protein
MVDTKMLFISQVNQALISTPAIGVHDAFDADLASNDGLYSGLSVIGHDFVVYSTSPLHNVKDQFFPIRTLSSSHLNTPCAKVGFINFNLPFELALFLAKLCNPLPEQSESTVNCDPVKTGQSSDFVGVQIKAEVLD